LEVFILVLKEITRDRPIWIFWGRYRYISHSWTNSWYRQL